MCHLHVGPAGQPLLSPPFPFLSTVLPRDEAVGQGAAPPMANAPTFLAGWASRALGTDAKVCPPSIHLPGNPSAAQ
jgi:hypothetical protein